jgi:hypothetical protein
MMLNMPTNFMSPFIFETIIWKVALPAGDMLCAPPVIPFMRKPLSGFGITARAAFVVRVLSSR